MKTFIRHDIPALKRIDGGEARLYETPDGSQYPSVTSVLSLHSGNWLEQWKKEVGAEFAEATAARASKRGTAVHQLCEDYLTLGVAKPNLFDLELYKYLLPYLDKIDNIRALETPLYSEFLKVAGTVDCIAEYEGKLAIIDFKTSSRVKTRDEIHSYFMQTAAYAVAFEELTGIPVGHLVIIMAVDHHGVIIFKEKRDDWIHEFIKLREEYRKCKNI